MVVRIQRQFVIVAFALLCASIASPASADTALVNYNFDYDVLNSGPDTYQIFQHKQAKAEISTTYASGGYASAHFTDDAHDDDFVEFQGYFPEQTTGQVRFQFKFLIANQNNLFNVALVGKERYKLSPLGINFWLIYEDGWLRHKSDSIPKKLFQPNLYEWYALDALLDLNKGTYSLRIARENGELAIRLENQVFAAGASSAHSLKEYSFVGDLADTQAADFYVDDVSLSTSNETKLPEMVAPGRRRYFFEIWDEYHRQLQGKLQCLPAKNLEDFGIYQREYALLAGAHKLDTLYQLIRSNPRLGKSEVWQSSPELSAIVDWIKACDALDEKKMTQARSFIADALAKKPNAYIFQLTSLIIDADRTSELASLYNRAYSLPQAGNEVRNQVALAMIAFHIQKSADINHARTANAALAALDQLSQVDAKQLQALGMGAVNNDYIGRLQRYMPDSWEQYLQWMLVLEQQYYSNLWQGNHRDAYALATQVTKKLGAHSIAPGIWQERMADGAFLNHDLDTALDLYNQLTPTSLASVLKMADMYHMQGDLDSEKSLREGIYRNFSKKR